MLHINSVSMPRSGHHYLHRILKGAYGSGFGYCDYYGAWKHNSFEECCKSIPCTKAQGFKVFMQKNHDRKMRHPYSPDDHYLVQIRHPVPRLISDFRLHCKRHPDKASHADFLEFADAKLAYYIAFWQKWVAVERPNIAVLRYEDLTEDTTSIAACLEKLSPGISDPSSLAGAAEAEGQFQSVNKDTYKPKVAEDFEYFDPDFMDEHATKVAAACEGFDYPIRL